MDFVGRIKRIVRARKVTIEISEAQELRIRAYMERVNHDQFQLDQHANSGSQPPYDLDGDEDFIVALDVLITQGLERDEAAHGLFGTDWGELHSLEQVNEASRRRRHARQEGD